METVDGITVIRDEKTWEKIDAMLSGAQAIIIPPDQAAYLDENFPGWDDHLEGLLESYEFIGDEVDHQVDVANHNTPAANYLDSRLIDIQQELSEE